MSTPDRPDPERLHRLNVGLTLHASVVVSAVLYLLLGSSGPPEARPTLPLLTVGAAGMFVLIAALPRRLVTRDAVWHPFLIAWDGLCVVAIAVAVIIDGADSTIGLLLNVPMVFVGLAFPRRAAIGVCATSSGRCSPTAPPRAPARPARCSPRAWSPSPPGSASTRSPDRSGSSGSSRRSRAPIR